MTAAAVELLVAAAAAVAGGVELAETPAFRLWCSIQLLDWSLLLLLVDLLLSWQVPTGSARSETGPSNCGLGWRAGSGPPRVRWGLSKDGTGVGSDSLDE